MKLEEVLKTNKFTDEKHKAGLNILYTAYWMKSHYSKVLKETGVTSEQFNVMRILKGKHPEQMCVKDIASRMIEKNSNVPRIADKLVVKKLVKRTTSKEDKRETVMNLTEKGLQTLETANNIMGEVQTEIIGITNEEAKLLNELVEKMRKTD
jgi:DNA-binding MarR family transcriptional regulator